MADDFFISAAQKRASEIDADLLEMQGGLARAKADNDTHTATQLIQGLANAKAERRNLEATYNEYVASQQPRQQAPGTEAEFMARAPERMTGEDLDRVFSKSKYYSKGQWADPEIAARVNAGWAEVQRRKARGE
jgi:hypothetical protein